MRQDARERFHLIQLAKLPAGKPGAAEVEGENASSASPTAIPMRALREVTVMAHCA